MKAVIGKMKNRASHGEQHTVRYILLAGPPKKFFKVGEKSGNLGNLGKLIFSRRGIGVECISEFIVLVKYL